MDRICSRSPVALRLRGGGWWAFLICLLSIAPVSLSAEEQDLDAVVGLFELLLDADADTAKNCLDILLKKIHDGEVDAARLAALRERLSAPLAPIVQAGESHTLYLSATFLQGAWRDPAALERIRTLAQRPATPMALRLQAVQALVDVRDSRGLEIAERLLRDTTAAEEQAAILAVLGRSEDPRVAVVVLQLVPHLDPNTQPKAIDLLTQRPIWSKPLLAAIGAGQLASHVLNANQVSKLLASKDPELTQLVQKTWGTLRTERNPQREQVIAETRRFLRETSADPQRGQLVFQKVCGQCHKIYGQGQDVGPDITVNGRASYEQLLSNVLDPSLVIGASYQARTVITADGRVLTGLVAEDSEQRIVLKTQGGKLESIPREDVDEVQVSQLSLMPEGLEKQLPPQELADLFAFLSLDKPPSDPAAAPIPGAR